MISARALDRGPQVVVRSRFNLAWHRFVATIDCDIRGGAEEVARLFRPLAASGHLGEPHRYELRAIEGGWFEARLDGSFINRVRAPAALTDWLVADVTQRALSGADRYVPLHAAAIAVDGAGVVIPGAPDAGKSTLAAALVAAGAAYLSDEVAPIDLLAPEVEAFPRPLVLEPDSIPLVPGLDRAAANIPASFRRVRCHVPADDVRAGSVGRATPVRLIVFRRFEPGVAMRVREVTPAAAVHRLAAHSFAPERMGAEALGALARVGAGARAVEVRGEDLDAAVRTILRLARDARAAGAASRDNRT